MKAWNALLMNSELVPSFAPDLEINQSFTIHSLHQGLIGWFFYFDWTLRNIWYCISDNFTKVTLAYNNYIFTFLPISKPELRPYFFTFTKDSFAKVSLSLKTLEFWCQNLVQLAFDFGVKKSLQKELAWIKRWLKNFFNND